MKYRKIFLFYNHATFSCFQFGLIEPDNINYLFGRGHAYILDRQSYKAIKDFTTALSIKPDDPRCLFARGNTYLSNYLHKEAIADYETILRVDPNNIAARKNLERAREEYSRIFNFFEE